MYLTEAPAGSSASRFRDRNSNSSMDSLDSFYRDTRKPKTASHFKIEKKKIDTTLLQKKKIESSTRVSMWREQSPSDYKMTAQMKWQKVLCMLHQIVDFYNLPDEEKSDPIRPGMTFYKMISSQENLSKAPLKIHFPETIMEQEGEHKIIRTNQKTGYLEVRKLEGEGYLLQMKKAINKSMEKMRKFPYKYRKHFDFQQNSFAPVIITKASEDRERRFEVDVQSYKNFTEWRSRPTSTKVVQRFIFPRNLKAMVFRLCYKRNSQGEQRGQYVGYRYQNVDDLLRQNKKHPQIWETFTLYATINLTRERQNKVEVSKVTNGNGLQRFIPPTTQLIKFLEKIEKIRINEISVDFIVDVYDQPWLINFKRIRYEAFQPFVRDNLFEVGNEGVCKLCSNTFLRQDLGRTISNKMLLDFLAHLKKRMRVEQYKRICFVQGIVKIRTKNHITFQVCQCCYRVVAEEFKLKQCEERLARICNINPKPDLALFDDQEPDVVYPTRELYQWRVMLFLSNLSNVPAGLLKGHDELVLRAHLGPPELEEERWKIEGKMAFNFQSPSSLDLNVNKLKVHYIYSQKLNIKEFLKETELNLELFPPSENQSFAKGSSSIFSNFRNTLEVNSGARQTSSVLLFYENGRYCEITAKVGLICDGSYHIPSNFKLTPWKGIYFAERSFINSNPVPREWMEAFGVNYELVEQKIQFEQIMTTKTKDQFIDIALQKSAQDTTKKCESKFASLTSKKSSSFFARP